jgi:cytochrome c-type biogenesis protein CcmH/NrfF
LTNQSQTRLRRIWRLFPALFLGVILLVGAGDNSARVKRLGHQMICMCGCSYILLECNHLHCPYLTPMREELVAAVDRGDADNTILQSFVEKYGTVVLAAPTTRGFNRVAWIMPYLALILGITLVVFIVGAWRRRRPFASLVDSQRATLDSELDRFREQARKETGL